MKTVIMLTMLMVSVAACGKAYEDMSPTEQKILKCDEIKDAKFWTIQGMNKCNVPSGEYCLYAIGDKIFANDKEIDPTSCEYGMFKEML